MNVQHEEKDTKGRFFIEQDGTDVAEMTYSKAGPSKIIIDHTQVSDDYRGQHLGVQLVKASVEFARNNEISILPLCPFARSVFDKKQEWSDVLK
ncbi:GNAT family N-acetyltransferase [Gracilimonas mengyeensis]|uniref:N-acetyltransferase domain-containing protein n=1 Tax=Gracilimonas mengyeensis TaxID=1302730 RepID=A0A521AML0_9BACT|nr:GNAT family N-acetyltransferase [Gracilimonas mengyeensis]SMO36043.1 hypothetical protein SAMN06265219_101241 [Gracilimonas mengyeensis]